MIIFHNFLVSFVEFVDIMSTTFNEIKATKKKVLKEKNNDNWFDE